MQSTRSSGTISSSASQGSSVRKRARNPSHMRWGRSRPTPATSHTGTAACRATAAAARDPLTARNSSGRRRVTRAGPVGLGHGGAEAGLRDVEASQSCRSSVWTRPGALAERVDDEHLEVAAARQRRADHVGPAEHGDGGVLAAARGPAPGAVVSAAMSPAASHISSRGRRPRARAPRTTPARPTTAGATRCGGTR